MASTQNVSSFNEHDLLHDLKHYLPTQAPLKDFIHHNTLHAFQQQNFFEAITSASKIFGYKTTLSIDDFRSFYKDKKINPAVLNSVIIEKKGKENLTEWTRILFDEKFDENVAARIGLLHSNWRKIYNIDLETFVLPILFRIVCSYLDQGVSIWSFPQDKNKGFLDNMLEIDQNSHANIFTSKRVKSIIAKGNISIKSLLEILIGKDESLYYQYIFDQQFLHQGWSGMVSSVEDLPQTLLINKKISLKEFIIFELLLEIDTLDSRLGEKWLPLGERLKERPPFLFDKVAPSQLDEALQLWQLAFEWSWYDQVLTGLQLEKINKKIISNKSFQGVFCIDDRECSFRRYLETFDSNCETFSTAGFFGVEFFFKPNGGKFVTKVCPAPITPKHLIKEVSDKLNYQRDVHFSKESHSIFFGWFISQTLGFWSALKLFVSLFKPSMSPATASSLKHMDKNSTLIIEHENQPNENDLKVGFSIDEMVTRVENVLRSIGMVKDFAPIVYIVGHGASSVNNPHYAAYDCGACSGRAGSVNARVFSFMANHPKVRAALVERGIIIPNETEFVGGIRDTTRDEVVFFDTEKLNESNQVGHQQNSLVFLKALDYNAKERSRRFESIDSSKSAKTIHQQILNRSVSLFEPRPELNHATNAACIVGRRELTKGIFLDRRSFLNSYDYSIDPEGNYLLDILNAVAPVCGGINLEYYFSRVDNEKLGAGSKLPHNVMGLIGVANGIDGDLRPGLPSQMIEVHDPVRLLTIVEHFPSVILNTIQRNPATYEWFENEWVVLIAVHPETRELSLFKNGKFEKYTTVNTELPIVDNLFKLVESHADNFPIYLIQ